MFCKKIVISVCLLLCCCISFSQIIKKGWSIGVNPLSFAEPHLSIGPCVSYRLSGRLGFWGEASYIFANAYLPERWTKVNGARLILQGRYYTGDNKVFFIAPEFRIKSYSFNNRYDFLNETTADTINNLSFRENQTLVGGAAVAGWQVIIFPKKKNRNMFLEVTLGIGGKQRMIKRMNVPPGYKINLGRAPDGGLSPNYEYEMNGVVYFPMSCRFYWNL